MSDLSRIPKPEGDSEVHMGHIIYLDRRFDNLDASFSDLLSRFQNLEETLLPRLDSLETSFIGLLSSFLKLETRFDNRFDEIESKLNDVIRHLEVPTLIRAEIP